MSNAMIGFTAAVAGGLGWAAAYGAGASNAAAVAVGTTLAVVDATALSLARWIGPGFGRDPRKHRMALLSSGSVLLAVGLYNGTASDGLVESGLAIGLALCGAFVVVAGALHPYLYPHLYSNGRRLGRGSR